MLCDVSQIVQFLIVLIYNPILANTSPREVLRNQLLELVKQPNSEGKVSWPEFENLYQSILADTQLEKLVTLDFELRQASWLEHGEPCDPSRQAILDNPPIAPTPPEIISWLRNLLSPPRTLFCNYLHYLHCSPESWTCTCREGLVQSPQGLCVLQAGTNCGSDFYFRNFYFDPLRLSKSLVIQPPPECGPGLSCCHRPLFFRKKCWCPGGHQDPPCDDFPIFSQKSEYLRLRLQMQKLFTLGHGDSCDPEFQRQILDPPEYDLIDTRGRVVYLEQVLRTPLKLCDISKHLNCSEETRQCECWRSPEDGKQLYYDRSLQECLANRSGPCGNTSLEAPFYPHDSPTVWQLQNVFTIENGLKVKCGQERTCQSNAAAQHCACAGHFFGDDCLFPGSNLTRALQQPKTFDPSITFAQVNSVYDQVNKEMILLEQRMRLGFHSPCDPVQDSRMDTIQSFWRNLSSYWGLGEDSHVIESPSTLQFFLDVKDFGAEILENEQLQLCDRSQGLCCSEKTSQCVCPKGTTRQDSCCRILAGHDCDLSSVPFRSRCVRYANCVRKLGHVGNLDKGICKCVGDTDETGDSGRSICEKPTNVDTIDVTLPDFDFGDEPPPHGSLSKIIATPHPARRSHLGRNPGTIVGTLTLAQQIQSTSVPAAPGHYHHIREIHDHLLEMGTHREVPLGYPCSIEDNVKFRIIAQHYSDANKFHVKMDEASIEAHFHDLTNLLATGSSFCDIQKHIECSTRSGTCQCLPGLFVNDLQECRIPEGEPCTADPIHLEVRNLAVDFIIPLPKCHQGLICVLNVNVSDTVCIGDGDIESRVGSKSPAATFQNFNPYAFFTTFAISLYFIVLSCLPFSF